MVQGMAFLSKKGFNPHNQVNRKQVWEAQQQSKLDRERVEKRQQQLQREREDEELCAARHNGDGSQAQLRFMYDAPPGLKKGGADNEANPSSDANDDKKFPTTSTASTMDVAQAQPDDDSATAAFRRMLAASTTTTEAPEQQASDGGPEERASEELGFAPVLQGSTMERNLEFDKSSDARSALEKAVGRKDRGGAISLEEQVSRFPQLKHAPMAKGMSATDVNVSFKPLGAQLRNVKCLACGVWGHSRGDRECEMTGWDPFSAKSQPATTSTEQLSSSIRPSQMEKSKRQKTDRDNRRESASESSSSSSDESDDSRRRRKQRHRKRRKDSRRRKYRRRSESPSRRDRSRSKSHKKKRSRKHD